MPARSFAPSLAILFVVAAGCEHQPLVIQYDIPTTVPASLQTERDRMLAAMVPVGGDIWFYKMTGPKSAVGSASETFKSFVSDLQYVAGEPVLDDLPAGWKRGDPRSFRFATLEVATEGDDTKTLDLSVSKLGRQDDAESFIIMNVNRWRAQLGLPASDEVHAGATEFEVAAADSPAMWVDIEGESSAAAPMSPPFAGGLASGPAGRGGELVDGDQMTPPPITDDAGDPDKAAAEITRETGEAESATATDGPVQVTPPSPAWRPTRTSSMRLAAFDAGPEDAAAEITVISAGGNLRDNVARWMNQIRGDAPPEAAVDAALAAVRKVTVDGRDSQRFYLDGVDGSGTAIDATIIPIGDGFSLFVKMTGPADTVAKESENIASFLASMKINL